MARLGGQQLARVLLLIFLLLASVAARLPPDCEDTGAGAAAPAPIDRALDQRSLNVLPPFELTPRTLLTLLLSLLVSALSNAAGVGGGAIFVPLFNVLLQFPIKAATALSQAVITGGALGSVAYSLGRRHPHAAASPLIDFDLALVLAPLLLLGVSFGVLLNIALPSWLITLLLIPLLTMLTWRTAQMGVRMWQAEQRAQQRQLSAGGAQHSQQGQRGPGGSPLLQSMELARCSGRDAEREQGEHPCRLQQEQQQSQKQFQQLKSRQAFEAGGTSGWEPEAAAGWQIASAGAAGAEGWPLHLQLGQHLLGQASVGADPGPVGAGAQPGHRPDTAPAPPQPAAQPGMQRDERQEQPGLTQSGTQAALPTVRSVPRLPGEPAEQCGSSQDSSAGSQLGAFCSASDDATHTCCESERGRESNIRPEVGTRAENEDGVAAHQLAALLSGMQGCQLSSLGLLDGVLEPELACGTPAQTGASPTGVGQQQHAQPCCSMADNCKRRQESSNLLDGQAFCRAASEPAQPYRGHRSAAPSPSRGVQAQLPEQVPALRLPWMRVAAIVLLWALFFCFQVGKERFSRCSWQAGLLLGSQAAVALAFTALFSYQACRAATQYRQQSDEGRPILGAGALSSSCGGDGGTRAVWPDAAADATGSVSQQAARVLPGWSYRQLAAASAVCLAGGCAAGTLGIGGGMIMAPMFLELGVHPQSASATSGLLVLFSASSAVLSFAAAGRLDLRYAAAFGAASLVAAFAGTSLLGRAVRSSGRASLLVLVLAGIIGVGAAVTAAFSGQHAVQELVDGATAAAPFCG